MQHDQHTTHNWEAEMVKTNLLCQLLLVMCCLSLVVVSAMPQRSSKRKDDDSEESCENGRCSRPGLRDGDSEESSLRKPGFVTPVRPRRPSLINAGPLNQQKIDASLGAGGSVDPACPTCTAGAACPTCTGATVAGGADRIAPLKKPTFGGLIKTPGSADQVDPSGAPCTNCAAAGGTAGTTGGPGTGGPTSTGATAGSANLADPPTGAACPTCKATGATPGTAGATGTTGTTGSSETSATRTPGTIDTSRIRKPGSATGTPCANCTAAGTTPADPSGPCPTCKSAGTANATATTGPTRIRKPASPGEVAPCANCTTTTTTTTTTCTTCTSNGKAGTTTASTTGGPGPGTGGPGHGGPGTGAPTSAGATADSGISKKESTGGPASTKTPSAGAACTNCTLATGTSAAKDSSLAKKAAEIQTPSFKSDMKEITNSSLVETVDHIHFDYDDPNRWKEHNSLCKGPHQSPIDIQTRKTILSEYPGFTFVNYDKSYPENLENNGHTVQLSIDKLITDLPSITGGGLDGTYQFAQLHFHWGEGMFGSEHTIDGKQYVAEVHIVHWDTKYGNFVNATKHNDGLAVLGVLVELQARDNIAFRHLEQFEKLIDVGCAKTDQLSYSVPLEDLLPDSTESYYRYAGSLTDARCNEDVIWTVFDTPIAISERQLAKFRLLTDEHGRKLTRNVRPTQHNHRRTVIYNAPPRRVA